MRWGPSASSDDSLVAAAQVDVRAFAQLYERYADQVFRYTLARTGSRATADDLTSDTFVAALERLDQFDPIQGSFSGWLFVIASRRIADHYRRRKRFWHLITGRSFMARHDDDLHDAEEDALETVVRRDEAEQVRAALARLPAGEREVVLLRYSAGLNSADVAVALGISHSAARQRLSRALRRLEIDLRDEL
jgi:RNA polymerase sigma-70 factor (ECF subfamily)